MKAGTSLRRRVLLALAAMGAAALLAGCGGGGSDPALDAPQMKKGKQLYQEYCQACHGGAGGGNLRDIPPPHNKNGHTWEHPDQQLRDMIWNSVTPIPGQQQMVPFKGMLTDEQIDDILAYIKTMWTDEQRASQATVTARVAQQRSGGGS